ncbi:hypothetical protein ACKS0A_00040 [Histoplasma ohiense]
MPAEFYQIYCVCFLFTPPFSPGLIDNEKKKKKNPESSYLMSYQPTRGDFAYQKCFLKRWIPQSKINILSSSASCISLHRPRTCVHPHKSSR